MPGSRPEPPAVGLPAPARVVLVGTGPGDPELLTRRALRRMRAADIALYDALVTPAILALLPVRVERHYVGKRRADHALPQEELNQWMVALARQGRRVVRLKGGDPFLFGRGGEEAEALAAAGVPFEIVPGVTAALGVAASTGIPLTHRDHAQAVSFATGQLRDGGLDLDWPALARPRHTVVIYMGLHGLQALCEGLIRHGRAADTPAAIVQHGTRPSQRVLSGTLATLPAAAAAAGLQAPTLIIVGEVVALHERFKDFLLP